MLEWRVTFLDRRELECRGENVIDAVSRLINNSTYHFRDIVKVERIFSELEIKALEMVING